MDARLHIKSESGTASTSSGDRPVAQVRVSSKGWWSRWNIARHAHCPSAPQNAALRRIMRRHGGTAYGLQHGFGNIADFATYQQRVPIVDRQALAPWLRYRDLCDPCALCADGQARNGDATLPEHQSTLVLALREPWGWPRLTRYFYEFVACDDWHAGQRLSVGLTALRRGVPYYLILTSDQGLYRYFTGMSVLAGPRLHQLPALRFTAAAPYTQPDLAPAGIPVATYAKAA